MPFTDQEYFEVIEKNEIVKKAFENIKQICIDLQKQTNCPEEDLKDCLLYTSPSPRDSRRSRMPSSA